MLAITKIILFFTIIITFFCYHETKKINKKLYFLHYKVSFAPLYVQNHSIKIGPDGASLNIIFNTARNFTNDPWMEIILSEKNRKEDTYRPIFRYDVNACNLLGKKGNKFNQFVGAWFQNVLKYGNFPRSCPIPKGNYYWHGLKPEQLNIPTFLPSGKYRGVINTYFPKGSSKISVDNLTLFGELK